MAIPLRSFTDLAWRTRSLQLTSIRASCASTTRASSIHWKQLHTSPVRPTQPCPLQPKTQPQVHSQYTQQRAFHASLVSQSQANSPPPAAKITYGVAASFTAKDRRYNPETNVFAFNPYNHIRARREDKRTRPASGQDAFFISRIGSSSDIALGIADGVGGWVDSGVDPADFAHGFCDYMAHAAFTHSPTSPEWAKTPLGARSLMQRGYEAICRDKSVPAGGSTACVGVARADGTLEVANLGDSGFVQLRLNAVHNYSEAQIHAFNTPYQLSVVPEKVLAQAAAFGGQQLCDMPRDSNVTQHELRHGDVLVFASDGVWDNLSRQDILRIVSRVMLGTQAWEHTDEGVKVGKHLSEYLVADDGTGGHEEIPSLQSFLAVSITGEAKAASVNTKLDGPFAKEVQKYYPHEDWHGGKVDDICVVVAVVCEEGK